ncbi:MAG: DUF1365 domain-containing protein [Planctomycetes bacterium]|nr:DUF1365 domain-containing protein [Planctomycetota bacterium]MBL7040490.1 DUF1365 domain-containing protein [Pirellulaceae bacterium]
MHSCIYEGTVRHRRFSPVAHSFRYPLYLMYLDLSELDEVFRGRWLWSTGRPNLAWFRRDDHLGDPRAPLDSAVRDVVSSRTGSRPTGPIRLLTNLRYFGYVINPVSFYFCYDSNDGRLDTIVAEVTNTPWGERHCYVLSESNSLYHDKPTVHRFEHQKELHVSPFMDLDMYYRWHITEPRDRLVVRIDNYDSSGKRFDSDMVLRRREISGRELARVLVRYPFMTARVAIGIYWQALKLWRKGAPFFSHPKHRQASRLPTRPPEYSAGHDEEQHAA